MAVSRRSALEARRLKRSGWKARQERRYNRYFVSGGNLRDFCEASELIGAILRDATSESANELLSRHGRRPD